MMFCLERMMDLGVRAVRGPRRLTEGVIEVLTSEVKTSIKLSEYLIKDFTSR